MDHGQRGQLPKRGAIAEGLLDALQQKAQEAIAQIRAGTFAARPAGASAPGRDPRRLWTLLPLHRIGQ